MERDSICLKLHVFVREVSHGISLMQGIWWKANMVLTVACNSLQYLCIHRLALSRDYKRTYLTNFYTLLNIL